MLPFIPISCTLWDLQDHVLVSLSFQLENVYNLNYKLHFNCRRFLYYRSLLSADISVNMKTSALEEAISSLRVIRCRLQHIEEM